MYQSDARFIAFGIQGDLDDRRARRNGVTLLIPAESEDHLLLGHDLEVFASSLVLTADEDSMDSAGTRVDLGDRAIPEHMHLGLGQEWPDGLRGGVDHDFADQFGHYL